MNYIQTLGTRSITTFWVVARIMIPVMIVMRLAGDFGVIEWLSPKISPVMGLVNLPPEAAFVFVASFLTGIYGGIAAMPPLIGLDLSHAQLTGLCLMMLMCHGIPVEQGIVKQAGGSFFGSTLFRVISTFISLFVLDWFCRATGYLNTPASLDYLETYAQTKASYGEWAWASVKGLALVYVVLVALLVMMDLFDRIGVTEMVNRLLSPVLRLVGIDRSLASVTGAGILLGLAYGGALIIEKGRDPSISPTGRNYALLLLSVCHALIEDTMLLVAVGGDILVLLVGRVILCLLLIKAYVVVHQWWLKRRGLDPQST